MKSLQKTIFSVILVWSMACLSAGTVQADLTYTYNDDFDTNQAETDSYSHSVFWPELAFPPAEPYLFYSSRQGNPPRSLMFVGFQGVPAYLCYCFPIAPLQVLRAVSGTLELDVLFPPTPTEPQYPDGYILYSLSSDGQNWSQPTSLGEGHHAIAISSVQGTCYVVFLGSDVLIDNLEVTLNTPQATIIVPDDYPTIQEAIDVALPGDIIEVLPGIYRGPGNRDIEFRGKAITVRSANGPDETIIDCQDSPGGTDDHRGFYFHEAEQADSILRGFTIRNGLIHGSEIPLDDMWWSPNLSRPIGGGIYCELSSPTIIDCVIRRCGTEVGGGIGCVGAAPTIVKCLIEDCRAGGFGPCESGGRGGGIGLIRRCNVRISKCRIIKNLGYYNSFGGGIYCHRSTAKVFKCNISLNSAEGNINGGGVYCAGPMTNMVLQNCGILRNTAQVGGGVFTEAGVPISDAPEAPICRLQVTNCTVAHNRLMYPMPPYPAGGIHSNGSYVTVKNSIVWYNEGGQLQLDPTGVDTVTFSDIQNGFPGQGNIADDPLFAPLDTSTCLPDYHLQSLFGRYDPNSGDWVKDNCHSPCIDNGDPCDLAGREPLPNGNRINMGAYGGTCEASKGIGCIAYHVDIVNGDDSNNGLTRQRAFAHIQRGISATKNGDAILVWPGVYEESLNYEGKAITIQSASDAAVIQAPNADGIAVTFQTAEGASSALRNFVISQCDIMAIFCSNGSPTITHVTVVDNEFGIMAYGNSQPDISNSIFWYNTNGDLFGCHATYSCVQQNEPSEENICKNPLFADRDNGDYHLRSRRGRFLPTDIGEADSIEGIPGLWVLDRITSPCVDRGDPTVVPRKERMPNGARINMGAYGDTGYASMSEWPIVGDSNRDGKVNLIDFATMAENWLYKAEWVN